ncbi:hypothetical protein [Psychrobacillus vulpis]|uniref:Uncharacterized protein n=1 Tax=Psychrobacillus vulpis TaxID=2325572 RepID=A0A544TDC7_9BACI|nr:hypothetical protein [Psychrobacillus vulpis]TQR15399.1 hypothetical protein FG384_19395 [Psychrobacillus vulpis]
MFNHVNTTATYQGNSFKIYPTGSSGLNYKDGDSFGYYLFPHDKEVDVDIRKDAIIEMKPCSFRRSAGHVTS